LAGAAVVAVLLTAGPAAAQSLREAIERGNALLAEGKPAEALAAYDGAAARHGATPELDFNRACALAAAGQFERAEALFREVDRRAAGTSPSLAAAARYNLGALAYRQGQRAAARGDAGAARQHLERAESLFRSARRLEPNDADAARNVELARREARRLEEAAQPPGAQGQPQGQPDGRSSPEQRDRQGPRQSRRDPGAPSNPSDAQGGSEQPGRAAGEAERRGEDAAAAREEGARALEDLARKQEAAAKEAESLAAEMASPDQRDARAGPAEERSREQSERQEALGRETERARERLKDLLSKEQGEAMERAGEDQSRAAAALRQQRPGDAAGAQREAARRLREAAESLRSAGESPPAPEGSPEGEGATAGVARPAEADAEPARRPADLTIAQILEKERREREMMQRFRERAAARARPVDKDW
jgi:Ca-activated chloride channel family protein